jgi:thiamine biosynthesis lipoprotein
MRTGSGAEGEPRAPAGPGRGVAAGARGLLLLLVIAACRPAAAPESRRQTRLLMGTYVTITAIGPAAVTGPAIAAAFARLEDINRRFNFRDSAGPLHAFNFRDQPFVDPEVARVVRTAVAVSAATGGAFDITAQPLVALWGFHSGRPAVPAPAALDSARALTGWRNITGTGDTVAKAVPGLRLDFGGIAKGYALAEAARVLRSAGVQSALVDAGGDIYAVGRKNGGAWRIGVRNPRGGGIVAVIPAADMAVVTSGDYERAFTSADGTTYCHIIDPRTGRPARGLAAVTVVAADPTLADAWATALFVLGPDAIELVEATDGIEALFVTPDLEMTGSTGLAAIIELPEPGDSTGR